jgi:uncharacterized protein (UPF0210 family)
LPAPLIPDRILSMKIRSITCFIDPRYPLDSHQLKRAGKFIKAARQGFADAEYEVQSARLASVPFSQLIPDQQSHALSRYAMQLEQEAAGQDYDYISLGPAMPGRIADYRQIPEAITATQTAFFSASLTTPDQAVSLEAVRRCAEIIQQTSSISLDGFGNLRFASLANVPPGSPFFPAAYHAGGEPVFALATEAADLAVSAFEGAASLAQARTDLIHRMETHAHHMTAVAKKIEAQTEVRFAGIDFSLAPYPAEALSLGAAMEQMGAPGLGNFGSLAAAAILADAIDQAEFYRAGFSGLMLPVLEDLTLARRAEHGSLQIKDLLLYSAVCGTGLDCIPLPGDTTAEQLSPVLLDLACLSTRLSKPLTARLLPIPSKKAGDPTSFDFEFFANSKVMALSSPSLQGLLAGDELIQLHSRKSR